MRYVIILTMFTASLFDCLAEPPHTNSSALTPEQFSVYRARARKIFADYNADTTTNALDRLFESGRDLQQDYPNQVNGWQDMMCAIEDCPTNNTSKARDWAKELMDSSAPGHYKLWAKGFLYRLDSQGKPVAITFTAVDGREVDLSKLLGKVVLVDFWGTHCGPCVAELPRVKTAYEKFHDQGFEVIGISCDTDTNELQDYVQKHGIPWPQYFDGHQQDDNKFTVAFGIDGIPHMFILDKKGCLRFDHVRAKGAKTDFEDKIESLLAEP